jgi:hypothetical protein
MYVDVSALGTASTDQRPFDVRYSPTEVGLSSKFDVPNATHELLVVQATVESGTEMPIAGRPVTWGITDSVAHDVKTSPAAKPPVTIRTSERTETGTRIIVSLRSSRPLSLC